MKKKIIIVGNGMVGYKFCEKLVAKKGMEHFDVTVFGEEPRPAYDRVHLSEYFSGKTAQDLTLAPFQWYEDNGIDLYLNDRVASIHRKEKHIVSQKGRCLEYDILILATGSAPFVPPVPGIDKKGVFVYRTIDDLEAITAYAKTAQSAAVIGGGLLGLEAAKAMVDLQLKTHVIEFAPRLMPRQVDQTGSDFLKKKIEELGVGILLNKNTKEIRGTQSVEGMDFADGVTLDVDMIVVSAGIKPRDEMARECGLEVGARGGIIINEQLTTSDPNIYAIGECALFGGMVYGLVAPGYQMADKLAANLLGDTKKFTGADMSTKLKLMGVDVGSFGDPFAQGENIAEVVIADAVNGTYKKMLVNKNNKTLVGGILVGDASDYGTLLQMYHNQMNVSRNLGGLLVKKEKGAAEGGDLELPDSTHICSCENITKGAIVAAVADGARNVADVKKATKAATGCGGCAPLITSIIHGELKKSGVAVDPSLCEHFSLTRQELVVCIKKDNVKNFGEALVRYGRGQGCEICKPAVASILASYVNEHVMNHQAVQDSNDRFLANIQKNGSYSVVPRVPGGEITPEQLIALGETARAFNLYTKITGGQRIDMFGARLEDLPEIWRRLCEAGLESGHAYAKALRTVKSCVGSTWCRYGVQDSVGLAIEIENRYKGLRAPHKIKSAVSGCSRECAEAQSKDFGVIATDKGYNLYVCGNGGMKPQHAVLFAEDLDKTTLIKYVDRFLMYYIRTADRLERTAVWFNKLEGGIKRLREIIIDDALGICDELEREMQYQVDTYVCEWKATLDDPERLRRFQPFINTKETDETIRFVPERDQIRPADEDEDLMPFNEAVR